MPSSAPLVRRLTPSDAPALRQLRLDALRETPEAFGSSYEEEHTLTLDDFQAWIAPADDSAMFGVFAEGALAGIIGVARQRRLKVRHKAHIWSVYVAPAWRGQGLARQLMQAALGHAGIMRGVRTVQLSVTGSGRRGSPIGTTACAKPMATCSTRATSPCGLMLRMVAAWAPPAHRASSRHAVRHGRSAG